MRGKCCICVEGSACICESDVNEWSGVNERSGEDERKNVNEWNGVNEPMDRSHLSRCYSRC